MNLSWIAFGLGEAAIGAVMIIWPRSVRAPLGGQGEKTDHRYRGQVALTQRAIGVLLLVMGGLVTVFGSAATGPDATAVGVARTALLIFAALWVLLGAVMVVRPEYVRSLTNPDHAASSGLALAASTLTSYRLTGVGFIAIGVIVLFVMLNASA